MTNQQRVMLLLPLFVVWVVVASAGLFYFGNQHYGQFAGDTDWQNSITAEFSLSALNVNENPGIQVVHVLQPDCICNSRAKEHMAVFADDYQVPVSAQHQRSLADVVATGFVLPASPAVLIFDDGQLIYAGPYATGPLCSGSDSLIAPILLKEVQLPGVWLNGEASACRCVFNPES
ncbi:DUF6436 domain-containing protein [Arsukibacterium sp.]|uniref:DUF6436 domain-containing protein n=1 Tax=Arsukibacterium sp. TaxID=1977258 RepID=UPI001BD6DE17|nr:DUF6436 domain-containing protein [Arsukibacterium sp.]